MDHLNTEKQSALSNATTVLVLGILSILGCCFYGIPGLIMGIIALVLASKDFKLYNANPQSYTPGSFSNLKAGRVCAIIGVILSAIYLVFFLVLVAMIGFDVILSGDPDAIREAIEQFQ
jgi:hypothetical protein